MSGPGADIGVVRAHASSLAAGPRPRLRPALEDAVSAVDERMGRRGRIVDDRPIELVWGRRAPLTVLRETRVQASWQVSPSVVVQIDGRRMAAPTQPHRRHDALRAAAPSAPPMRLATIERRLETRVVGRAVAALTESAREPVAATDASPIVAGTAPPVARTGARDFQAPTHVRVPPSDMAVAHAPRSLSVAAAPPASSASDTAAAAARPSAVRASPGVPALSIDRITTEVMHALDSRLIAWRERMGRA